MLILGINSGSHDACACLFDEYRMLAAVPLERVTRKKGDGGRIPVEAIDECLAIAGRKRAEIGAVAMARGMFPTRLSPFSSGATSRLRAPPAARPRAP
jgi:carbamoyltransferase